MGDSRRPDECDALPLTAHRQLPTGFLPEARWKRWCLAGLLARLGAECLPGCPVADCSDLFDKTYSSGDCPGFAPGSLFILIQHQEPKTGAKVV